MDKVVEEKTNSRRRILENSPDILVTLCLVLFLVLTVTASWTITPFWIARQHPASLVWWLFIAAAAWMQGRFLFTRVMPDGLGEGAHFQWAVSIGLGLGMLSTEALLLGLAGLYNTAWLTALVIVALMIPAAFQRGFLTASFPGWPTVPDRSALIPLALAVLAVLVNMPFALSPPVFFDAMTYHLELPARYLQAGRIFHIPENLYSGYPQLIEVLFGMGLALSDVALAGLISLTALVMTLALLWTWARRRFGDEGAGWGIAILAFTPPFMVMVGFFHNDWITTFYTLAAVFILEGGDRGPRRMALAGVMAGLAAGCKYTALGFAVAAPLGAGLADDLIKGRGLRVGSWSLFLAAVLVAASPWYIKNLVLTGDPLYPLLAGLAGSVDGLEFLAADTHLHRLVLADMWRWIRIPFVAIFRPEEIQLSQSAGFLPLVLLPTLLSLRKSRTGSLYLGVWVILSFAAWYMSFHAGRFLLSVAAVAFLYLGTGLARATAASPRLGKVLKAAVILILVGNVGSFMGYQTRHLNTVKVALGTMNPESYLLANYPPYPAIKFLNELDPPAGRVLFVGEMKGFYSRFAREVPTFELPNRLLAMVREGISAERISFELSAAGFTHILFNPTEMARLSPKSPQMRLNEKESEALGRFLEVGARLVFQEAGMFVFEIRHGG